MSVKVLAAARQGIVIEGTKEALGFPAPIATLFANNLKGALANDPVAVFEDSKATYGRPHPLAELFGGVESFTATLRVYPIGTTDEEESVAMDAWVSEDEEGNILLAYCPEEIRKDWVEAGGAQGSMSMLAVAPDDLDEALETLGQDFASLEDED